MTALLELTGLSAGYGRTPVLHDVSLTVGEGEIVALIGANGAGKSTLLNTIMNLLPAQSGEIKFNGKAITGRGTPSIVHGGLVQVPERRQLFGTMTVEENLRMGAYTATDRGSINKMLEEQYTHFPILGQRRSQLARTLSGGEQQMVAIARAAMSRPKMWLLDEPSLGLAPLIVQRIMDQIVAIRAAKGTVLVVEQNARAALQIADRGYVLENGRITASGEAHALLNDDAVLEGYLGGAGGTHGVEASIRTKRKAILGR